MLELTTSVVKSAEVQKVVTFRILSAYPSGETNFPAMQTRPEAEMLDPCGLNCFCYCAFSCPEKASCEAH